LQSLLFIVVYNALVYLYTTKLILFLKFNVFLMSSGQT